MPHPTKKQVVSAQVFMEGGAESSERLRGYVVQALKSAMRNLRDGAVAIVIRDENERIIGVDISGEPSQAFAEDLEELFDKYDIPDSVRDAG